MNCILPTQKDAASNLGRFKPALQALVAELTAQSPHFGDWWTGHVVQRRRSSTKRIRTPDGTVVERHYEVLHLPDDGLRMTLWLPVS